MKKTVYGIFAALTFVFAFAACDDDSSDIDRGTHARLPEQAIAGDYTGTYTLINDASGDIIGTVPATITFTAGENSYTAKLDSKCVANADLTDIRIVNVIWVNDERILLQGGAPNPVTEGTITTSPSALYGTYTDGTVEFSFSITVQSGRTKTTTNYIFTTETASVE